MAVFVISIHTIDFHADTFFGKMVRYLVDNAVPFFFITSGYLLYANTSMGERKTVEDKLLAEIKRMIKLYGIWTIIYLPITIFASPQTTFVKAFFRFLRNLLFRGENIFSWPLWYLLSSIYALSFLYIVIHFLNFKKVLVYTSAGGALLLIYICDYLSHSTEIKGTVLLVAQKAVRYTITDGRIFTGIFYIVLGLAIAEYQAYINLVINKRQYLLWIGCIVWIVFYAMSPYKSMVFFLPISSSFAFLLCTKPYQEEGVCCLYARKASSILYFTHMIWFVIYTNFVCKSLGRHSFGAFLATCFLSFVGATIILSLDHFCNGKIYKMLF